MFKKILLILSIIFIIISNKSFAFGKDNYRCTHIQKIAKDMGFNVSKLSNNTLELVKDGKYIYAELDIDFCSVTLVSKLCKRSTDKINLLQLWNNKKGMVGKGLYSEQNIFFEQTIIIANAPEELIAMQIIIYEVELQKFFQSLKVNKVKI